MWRKNMKTLKLSTLLILLILISGCSENRVIIVPQSTYYPKFPIEHFNKSDKYKLELWTETEEINGTEKTYIVSDEKFMLGFIKDTKNLRKEHNLLIDEVKKFNEEIDKINKIQSQKTPYEIRN